MCVCKDLSCTNGCQCTEFFIFLSTVWSGDHQRHVPGEVRRVPEGRPEERVQRRLQTPPLGHLPLKEQSGRGQQRRRQRSVFKLRALLFSVLQTNTTQSLSVWHYVGIRRVEVLIHFVRVQTYCKSGRLSFLTFSRRHKWPNLQVHFLPLTAHFLIHL